MLRPATESAAENEHDEPQSDATEQTDATEHAGDALQSDIGQFDTRLLITDVPVARRFMQPRFTHRIGEGPAWNERLNPSQ